MLYCLSLCHDRAISEDLVAEAFVKAYLSLQDQTPSFQFWLFRVCRNLWIDHTRRNQHQTVYEIPENLPDFCTPENRYLANERQLALWNAIRTLSPQDQELITLHYFSGMPLNEAAQLLGVSYPAVRQRMVRLRATLRQQLEEQGYGTES